VGNTASITRQARASPHRFFDELFDGALRLCAFDTEFADGGIDAALLMLGTSFPAIRKDCRLTLARALHLGSFRTYRGRTIADINANPQSISPKSGSGYLPGGDGPPCSARPILATHRR
jgi:hypothetical protein